ncbi:MAG: kinase [Candidatus Omnitrophota bacterium]|nr:kinase [Candidatus Omnitrophota bacterium]
MIISRTPFRISFFGGGTDYPEWYHGHPGVVLATTIDKYCYITLCYVPPFFDWKYRIVYSKQELVRKVAEIQHPAVREGLRYLNIKRGISLQHVGDLPARTGIGSSSSFTVGFLHALHALQGRMVTKKELAFQAIEVEQEWIKENVGSQDQVSAAFGGLNKIEFNGYKNIEVSPVTISVKRMKFLQQHLMLFFTGFSRTASEIAEEQIKNIPHKIKELKTMYAMVNEALNILNHEQKPLENFGKLLHETWLIKKTLSKNITNSKIDEIYLRARKAGAIGGKILGAGGGGFMLLYVKRELQSRVKQKLKGLIHVPFRFDELGSQIIYYRPNSNY